MYLNNAVLVPDLSISRDAQESQRVTQNNVKAQFDRQGQLRLVECSSSNPATRQTQTAKNEQ